MMNYANSSALKNPVPTALLVLTGLVVAVAVGFLIFYAIKKPRR